MHSKSRQNTPSLKAAHDLYRMNRLEEALQILDELKLKTIHTKILEANCYLNLKQYGVSTALNKLEILLRKYPSGKDQQKIFVSMFYAYIKAGDNKLAEESLLRIPAEFQKLKKPLIAWIDYYMANEKYETANEKLQELTKIIKPHQRVEQMSILEYEIKIANFTKKPLSEIWEKLFKLLQKLELIEETHRPKYLNMLVRVLVSRSKTEERLDAEHELVKKIEFKLEKIIDASPNFSQAYFIYAFLLLETNQLDRARKKFEYINRHYPYYWESQIEYLYLLTNKLTQHQDAIKAGEQLLELINRAPEKQKPSLSYIAKIEQMLAIEFSKIFKFDEYHKYLDLAYQHDPENAKIISSLAKADCLLENMKNHRDLISKRDEWYDLSKKKDETRFYNKHLPKGNAEKKVDVLSEKNDKRYNNAVSHQSPSSTLTFANFQKPVITTTSVPETNKPAKRKRHKTKPINTAVPEPTPVVTTSDTTSHITNTLTLTKPTAKPKSRRKKGKSPVVAAIQQAPSPTRPTWTWDDSCCGMFKFFRNRINDAYVAASAYYNSYATVQADGKQTELKKRR